jgi:hypothetical protein
MSNTSLCTFVSKVRSNNRIRFGDLRRLQRDILPRGLSTQHEAEALLDLDRSIERADEGPGDSHQGFRHLELHPTRLRRSPDGEMACVSADR